MILPQINCYHVNAKLSQHEFFVLSKGNNAGRPSLNPWTNCFSVSVQNQNYFDFYFWLVYGLWKADKFKMYHRGSVISFLTVTDIRIVIREVAPAVYKHWEQYQKIVSALGKLEEKKSSLAEQIIATDNLQAYLIRAYFKDK